jgi:hypothetical protein
MDPFTTPDSRNTGSWAYPPRKRQSTAFAWWLRAVAATAITGFAIFAADRALPSIAATAIEAEQQAELFKGGW